MILHVKLRDGFSNDSVTITVNGKNVYYKAGVTTDLTISFADAIDISVEESTVKLAVAIERGQKEEKELRVQETPFIDVRIINGKLELWESQDEFPMV